MLKFKTISDERECRELWEAFSPKQVLWDLWGFRHCFHTKNFEFNFVLGYDEVNEGIIPLVYDKKNESYIYFGDTFPEQNKFFLRDRKQLKPFLDNCPKNTQIYYIDAEEAKYFDFKPGDRRYFLDLEKYGNSFENYIKSFAKKHRKNLNYDLKKLRERGYTAEKNEIEDFDRLVEFNKKRFGKDSDYNEKDFAESMKQLIDLANKKNILDIISIRINNDAEAIGLGVFYNNAYYVLGIGRNAEIKNIGKLLIAEQIKSAIGLKCNEVDFLSTESNWKELWNLDSEQMYEFEK